jgi:hypothetical protein
VINIKRIAVGRMPTEMVPMFSLQMGPTANGEFLIFIPEASECHGRENRTRLQFGMNTILRRTQYHLEVGL